MARIAILPGDGVGPEVTREAVKILEVAAGALGEGGLAWDEWPLGADRYLETGSTITEEEFHRLANEYDALLLGAFGDPRVPNHVHARDILLGLRTGLDLYVNHRPCRLLHPALSPLKAPEARRVDLHLFRENTEGSYGGLGGTLREGTPDEVAVQEDLNTRRGVERIVRAAFGFARERGRSRVTLVDKANAMPYAGRLWRRTFEEVGEAFPDLERDALHVDAAVMELVRRPWDFDVIVTSNLFGDILSDLGAALVGGAGLAPSANLNPGEHALFEPVHGSAPDIAGTGTANPVAAILSVGLLLEHLERADLARKVEGAVVDALQGGVTTPDLGGRATTEGVGTWIARRLEERLGFR